MPDAEKIEPKPVPHDWKPKNPPFWGLICARCGSEEYGTVNRYCPPPTEG